MPKRVDKNHSEIIAEFRRKGAKVEDTHALPGFVDCVVSYRGLAKLIEIKSGKGKLTDSQERLQDEHGDAFAVVRDEMDVQNVMDELLIKSDKVKETWE